jgi:O-antigen/teichoic acid export membrane protein
MGRLIKNTAVYAFGNILPQLFGFVLLPLYTQYLTPNDYGIVTSMQVLTPILMIFFTISLDSSVYRLYYDYKTDEDKRNYLGTISITIFVVASILLILLFVFHNFVEHIYTSISFFPYYAIAIATAFVTVFTLIPKIYFQVNEKATHFVILSLLQFFATTGLVVWFIVFKHQGALGMLKGVLYGNAIILPVFLFISIKIINFKFDWNILKPSLYYCLPLVPYVLSNWVMNMSNRIFIDRYFTPADNGIYSLGFKIASVTTMLTTAIALSYFPYFFKLANSEDQTFARKELYKNNNLIIIVLIFLSFLIALFSKDLVCLFMSAKYRETFKVIPLLVMANLFVQFIALVNLSFSQAKKTSQLMYIVMVTAVINIIANALLIPHFGLYGAAYASIVSQGIYFLIGHYYSKRYYYIKFNWLAIFGISLTFASVFLLSFYFIKVTWLSFIVKGFVVFVILGIVYFKFFERFKNIISNKELPVPIDIPAENQV